MSAGSAKTGKIGWVDLTVRNADEVRDFYSQVVGWEVEEVSMGEYSDFSMLEPQSRSAAAGICHARGPNADLPPQWLIYIIVNNLAESLEKCRLLGGEVLAEPPDSGSAAKFAVIRDPAGAVAALYQE
ncbi:MAG: VOC family protein [Calditrichia bacterium]